MFALRIRLMVVSALCVWLIFAVMGGAALSAQRPVLSPHQPSAVVPACNPITTNTTWTAGNLYLLTNCPVTIPEGITLTIEPGTTVKFLGGQAVMIVNGTLFAQGNAAQPITFSSVNDNAHGQAAPGSSGAPAAGDWYGLHFSPGSHGQISHAFIGYGTANAFQPVVGWNKAHVYVDNAAVTFANLTLAFGGRPGIYLKGSGDDVQITDSFIHDHTGTVSYPGVTAIYQESINMQPVYNNLTFSGNTRNEVTIGNFNETLMQDVTLGGTDFGFVCGYTLCQLTVPNSTTLTVAPGTLLDFRPSYGIAVASGGRLIAEGTPTQPITFTSQLAAAGTPNQYWIGLWAQQGSTLRLDHCDISYGSDGNFGNGGLEIDTDDAQVRNCKIHHNKGTGLYLLGPSNGVARPVLTNVEVTDNGQTGVHFEAKSGAVLSVTWDGGAISRNGWSGMSGYTWNSIINPTLRSLTIANNGALGDFPERRAGIYWNQHNVNPTLDNLTITGNVGTAVFWYCNGSIAAGSLTATGNGANELILPGCIVGGGRQWDLGDAGIPTRVTGNIQIEANGLLSLQPGTVLRFDRRPDNWSYGLYVPDQASLYALGTAAKPIRFVGTSAEMNWWNGIEARNRATIVLHHCEIAYGGKNTSNNLSASLVVFWGLSGSVPTADIQNCEIHHSGRKGVHFDFNNYANTPASIFRYNSLHDNVQEAVANWNAPPLDARDNYWGDPTGPFHATQNPGGLGDDVGDNIIFYPWLGAPASGAAPGAMMISTGAPTLVSPGETVDYAIQYLNGMTETVRNSLLVVQLPSAAEYVASNGGGIYWPERDQVFWKLGDLPPGSQGFLTVQLHFAWGLPSDYSDSSITLFTADNYNPGEFDTQPYLAYAPGAVNAVNLVSRSQFDAQLAASPALKTAYDAAVAAGYTYHSAANVARTEGETVLEAVLVDSQRRAARILGKEGAQVLVYTVNAGEAIIEDGTGGMRIDLITGDKREWGGWAPVASLAAADLAVDGCTADVCKRNCRWTILGWEYIKKKAGRVVAWTALAPFTGGGSVAGAVWEIGSTAKKLYDCDLDCRANPSEYCCTAGQVRWSGGGLFGGLTNSCYREKCNAAVGLWVPDGYKTCIAFGERCVAGVGGPGCVDCEERGAVQQVGVQTIALAPAVKAPADVDGCSATAAGNKPRCRDLDLRRAKDPNAIYGPEGDLLPDQIATYTITYENEGAGRAYGVYVVNQLSAAFNAGTLNFVNKAGTYLPQSREIFWLVGELAPKGAAGSTGIITYTVALTGSLPSGTGVANQAVVYFPSVPEETPTNTWVNLVAPLVATPQMLTTGYMKPLSITLSGRKASGPPLTYAVVEQPHGGTLAGTSPNLTYTPIENFTGADSFTFSVSNGASTSRPAQVSITVTPAGDTTPPQILWTNPAADATGVDASATPVFSDAIGPAFTPVILIGVSEALNPTTVHSGTVTLARSGGAAAASSAAFDGGANQIVLIPRAALGDGEYTVTVMTGVKDLAGNALAAPRTWRFTVGMADRRVYLPLVLRN